MTAALLCKILHNFCKKMSNVVRARGRNFVVYY